MDINSFYANNAGSFSLLGDEEVKIDSEGRRYLEYRKVNTRIINAGKFKISENRVNASDIVFADNEDSDGFILPNGIYDAVVTIADVSEKQDGSHDRTAYLSLINPEGVPVSIHPAEVEGKTRDSDDEVYSFGVDAGTGCFSVNRPSGSTRTDVDDEYDYCDKCFDLIDEKEFALVDENGHEGGNPWLFGSSSGWGDGGYAVYVSKDDKGAIVGIHIDYEILGEFNEKETADYFADLDKENQAKDTAKKTFFQRLFALFSK